MAKSLYTPRGTGWPWATDSADFTGPMHSYRFLFRKLQMNAFPHFLCNANNWVFLVASTQVSRSGGKKKLALNCITYREYPDTNRPVQFVSSAKHTHTHTHRHTSTTFRKTIMLLILAIFMAALVLSAEATNTNNGCSSLPDYDTLTDALRHAVRPAGSTNGGSGIDVWATLVDRNGVVCVVTKSGSPVYPVGRISSATKAFTANFLSVPGAALSTANLYSMFQPGGGLFGFQNTHPVDESRIYSSDASYVFVRFFQLQYPASTGSRSWLFNLHVSLFIDNLHSLTQEVGHALRPDGGQDYWWHDCVWRRTRSIRPQRSSDWWTWWVVTLQKNECHCS